MSARATRVLLGVLAVFGLQVGAWAAFAPRAFYDDFPRFGRAWVAVDGPYNEHLVRDVGGLNLALALLAVCAIVWLQRSLVVATAVAWLTFSVLHLVYHLRHLDPFDGSDVALVPLSLLVTVIVPIVLLARPARAGPAVP